MAEASVKINELVPTADSASNITIRDVIGNKNDTHAGTSINAQTRLINEHHHSASKVYPTLAPGANIPDGGAPWVLSAGFTPIVPIGTIINDFDVHYISIEGISANDVYELVLYYGAANTEAGRVRFIKNAVQDGTQNVPMQTIVIPANSAITAKVASAIGGNNVTISIFYHVY